MAEEILIEIDLDGKTTVAVNGVKGSVCDALTKEIEDALGNPGTTTKEHTTEYNQRAVVRQDERQTRRA